MENGETFEKICPVMSSQGNLVYCRENCAWFSDISLIADQPEIETNECVFMSILRIMYWINSNT